MVSVEEATQLVLSTALPPSSEKVDIQQAAGRVLQEDLVADRDFPPFDRVSMDGLAIRFDSFENGHRFFPIEGLVPAGHPALSLVNPLHGLEVMTGCVCPEGTDTVVRYEDLSIRDGIAEIKIEDILYRQNVHRKGKDRKAGERLVEAGRLITPAEVAVAASIGKSVLSVAAIPKVAVISSGDELVDIDQEPLPHQIRKSNAPAIAAVLGMHGIQCKVLHLPDDEKYIREMLPEYLKQFDALILSGGVSMGKFDYLPEAFLKEGVDQVFYKVTQRPGKPFWYGVHPGGCRVFAFPGNPVSSFMCTHRYFLPWLRQSLGLPAFLNERAVLMEDYAFNPNLTYFLQVKTETDALGCRQAFPATGHGSGDFANLTEADGFLELPQGRSVFKKGEDFPYFSFRNRSLGSGFW